MTTFKWQNWVNSTVTASFRSWSRAEIARLGYFWSSVLTREHFELNLFLTWTRLLKQYQFNTTPRCLQGAPALFSERPSLPKGLKGLKTQIALTKRQKLSCYNCVLRHEQCFWIYFFLQSTLLMMQHHNRPGCSEGTQTEKAFHQRMCGSVVWGKCRSTGERRHWLQSHHPISYILLELVTPSGDLHGIFCMIQDFMMDLTCPLF